MNQSHPKTPHQNAEYKAVQSILPSEELKSFLEKHLETPQVFKVPAVIEWTTDFPARVISIYFGANASLPEDDRVMLEWDDGKMGIGLVEHLQALKWATGSHPIWLIGTFESSLGLLEEPAEGTFPYSILQYGDQIAHDLKNSEAAVYMKVE